MIIKYTNADIFGFDNFEYKKGCVVVENNRVIYAGQTYNKPVDIDVDCLNKTIIPALTNMFVNINGNFVQVLNSMLNNGVVNCVFNGKVSYDELTLATTKLNGVAYAINVNKLYPLNMDLIVAEVEKLPPNVKPVLYVDDILNLTELEVETIYLAAKKHDIPVFVVASENLEQVGICHNETGKTPIELIEDYGLFDLQLYLMYCNSVDKYDLEILEKYNANIIVFPIEDMQRGSGITPIASMVEHNLNISLGSINPSLNLLNTIRIIKLTQSGYLNKIDAVFNKDLLKIVTQNNLFNLTSILVIDEQFKDYNSFILTENKPIKANN